MGEALTDHSADIFVPPTFFCDAIFNQKELTFQTRRANILTPCTVSLGWRKIERYIIEFRLSSSLKQNAPRRGVYIRAGSPVPRAPFSFQRANRGANIRGSADLSIDRGALWDGRQFFPSSFSFLPPYILFPDAASPRKNICFSCCCYRLCDSVTRSEWYIQPNKFREKKEERQREKFGRTIWDEQLFGYQKWRYANVSNTIFLD